MKVLWFSNTPANADEFLNSELKGSGGWLKTLDQYLQQHVDLHVVYYGNSDDNFKFKNTNYYSVKRSVNTIDELLNRIFNYNHDKHQFIRYVDIVNTVKPDIIHIHGTENNFAHIISRTNIPVVVSIQGNITFLFHKIFSGFDKRYLHTTNRNILSVKNFLFPKKFIYDFRLFKKLLKSERKYLSITKHIIGRTLWDKRITRILAPESKYYYGGEILRELFYNSQWVPNFNKKLIIHCTNGNSFYKGFETICQALTELNRIGVDCEFHIAGISPNDLIVKITRKKLKNNFPEKGLILKGSLNDKSLIESLLNANIFVMSSHIENSPNSLCEAMILGMPCVSTFTGGTGTLLKDGEEGILIQDGDPWAMAGAILELYTDPELAIKYGKMARENAVIRHNINNIVNDLLKTYDHIVNDK